MGGNLLKRYQKGAQHFQTIGKRAWAWLDRTPSVSSLFKKRSVLLKGNLELQRGLKDEFERAIKRSSKYIREMERIFKVNGLPKELTRIAFVNLCLICRLSLRWALAVSGSLCRVRQSAL